MRHRPGRATVTLAALVLSLAATSQLSAASSTGELKAKVIAALTSVAGGKCPEDLMGPVLLDTCEQQLEVMKARLRSLGAIKRAEYKGIETLQNGMECEAYKVFFENGTMIWLAAAGSNGKLVALWSPG